MFLISLFQRLKLSKTFKKDQNIETKKCLKCLKYISIDYLRCPYCRGGDFQTVSH